MEPVGCLRQKQDPAAPETVPLICCAPTQESSASRSSKQAPIFEPPEMGPQPFATEQFTDAIHSLQQA